MARLPKTGLLIILLAALVAAQEPLTLEQASWRKAGDFTPAHAGENIVVAGTVSAEAVRHTYYTHLAIQDEHGYGFVLEGGPQAFPGLSPGDQVEAQGTVAARAGMPVLRVTAVQVLGAGPAPAPRRVSPSELFGFRYGGVSVLTEGRVLERGVSSGGEYLLIGEPESPLKVFLPVVKRDAKPALGRFDRGDRVRVSGIASQHCPMPPYNRHFQLAVASVDDIALLEKRWIISLRLFVAAVTALGIALGIWWLRERRLGKQRRVMRSLYLLGEEVIGLESTPDILARIAGALPAALGVSGVRVYLHNRSDETLEPVPAAGEPRAAATPLEPAAALPPQGPAACFRNQMPLAITSTRRSPFLKTCPKPLPRSLIYLPMAAQGQVLGVLEIFHTVRSRRFTPDEQVAAQHLANQIAISLRLMEQDAMREQLWSSEKLAAAGQLVSTVAAEIREPLERIVSLAEVADISMPGEASEPLRAILREARKGAEIVARVVSFTGAERGEAAPVDVNALVRNLLEFRRQAWQARGLRATVNAGAEPVFILGSQGQLERVLLDLLVQIEQAASDTADRAIEISESVLGRRILLELTYSSKTGDLLPGERMFAGVMHSYGGALRLAALPEGRVRVEIELPLAPPAVVESSLSAAPEAGYWPLTVLVVEAEPEAQRTLIASLSDRGCRAVPVPTAEQALELVQRVRFDLVMCSVRLPGLNWVEFHERIRGRTGGFVLLMEGRRQEAVPGLPDEDAWTLGKPVRPEELEEALASAARRAMRATPVS